MWRLAIKQVAAHRFRFVLTTLAVVLGVTFVSGTLVLTDTSQQLFDDRFASRSAGSDLTIRTEVAFDEAMGVEVEHDPVPAALVDDVRDTAGVDDAAGMISGKGTVLVDGDPVSTTGQPLLLSWAKAPFGGFEIISGRPPQGHGEVVLDQDTARRADVQIGATVTVQSDRVGRFRVVGLAQSTRAAAYAGSSVALTGVEDAQNLLRLGERFSEIQVTAADDTTVSTLEDRLREAVGETYAVTSSKDVARASSDAARTQLGYLQGMLFALAAAALLIGGYLIANTFTIVVAQRTRELALLRAAGATGRQVRRLLRGEALVVGVVGSAVGTVLGIGAAAALRSLLAGVGADLPSGPAVIRPGSMLLSFAIGVGVTMVGAVAPSRRAGRVSPLQAMRSADAVTLASRRRRVTGTVAGIASAAALGAVVLGQASVSLVAAAAVLAVVALAALGPVLAGPLTKLFGRPLASTGVPGRLAGEFAARAPRRTAATVMALSLSVALVAFMTVLAASMKKDISDRYEEVIRADLIVESSGAEMLGGLSPEVYDRIAALPEVEAATRMRIGHFKHGGATTALSAIDPATIDKALRIDLRSGELGDLDTGGVLVSEKLANQEGLQPGDTIDMTFPLDGEQQVSVVGVFDDDLVAATQTNYLIGLDTYADHYAEDVDADVFVQLATGTDTNAAEAAIADVLAEFPNADVRDQAAAATGRTTMVDQILGLVTVLLLLTVLIALLGVTNTLALSIVERTREIGLLRAIGMTTRQVRWMIRSEAALQAALSVVLGSVLGLAFAAATVLALGGDDPMTVVVPWGWLATVLVAGTTAGLLAGLLPARRAARLRLMAAISSG
jgi:putative ABC transport system permease protein